MRTYIASLVIGLLMISTLSGQVKIGDNPQNLDPSSVLELESGNRVLVITRVSNAQMSMINPLPGALVYNTDQECINYYNGTEWINICEALDNSFTVSTRADFLSQINQNAKDSTVVITPTLNPDGSTNYNFEVAQITGANIASSAVNGDKIQNGTVGSQDLAPKSVGLTHIQDGGADGDLLQWNGTVWELVNEADIVITETDGIIGNEVFDATAGGSLVRSGGGTDTDPYTLDVSDGGIGNAELGTDAVTTDKIFNGTIITEDMADDAVTSIKILDANVTNAKLDKSNIPLSGFGTAAADIDLGLNKLINVDEPTVAADAATKNYVDTEIAASNQTIVSADAGNSITASGIDGGAFYDDSTIQSSIAANTTAIGTKENSSNKSPDVLLGTSDVLFPTQNAVKTYVDTEISVSNQTIVSADAGNSITASGTDGGAFYDDSTIQSSIAANTTAIGTKENSSNKSPDVLLGTSDALFPTQNAVKTYVDTEIATSNQTVSAGTGISVTPTGQDFQVTNLAPDLTVALADGGNGNVTIGGTYPNFTIDVPDNTDNQDLSIGGSGVPNQTVEVAISGGASALIDVRDSDDNPTNEIQNVIQGTGIAVSQIGLDFIVENTEPDKTVTLTDGGSGNVTIGGAYPNFTIDVPDITTGNITSSDLNVTGGTNAVLTNVSLEINPGAVGNLELAANAVTTDKIADGAVESSDIADGTITNADINSGAAIDGSKINPNFNGDVNATGDFIGTGFVTVPDFVFQKYYNGFSNLDNTYQFKSLKEIEAFVKENNHLPGIRSAYEIKASGKYRLTESSLAQLEKIEELFLHTIEQEKKIEKLQSNNQKLTNEVNGLKAEMEKIKAMLLEKKQN